ncbi:receptor-like serine/threonine-protein kinase NCRK [Vigna radiata var. radiata]|uniref:non-specific serine/threonine protein kinase n=1 Tax=Vigna radiata var. radiata TaxID=3916 RepID=A0A1S3TKP8_VIGRR|nr:receptor-like serine/threonine-protein kinase NCRK [Vigna radiata var. radiata]XP_014494348.1 receptor-like serine/threonine-protein kinase NCRK [Vigna radiata var. radiata]XP_014494349.1 receptor-like serine/threonine-protein kinase NCRK [Vigna radiata var. radiata]XP_014494350.1 receptor-like serine/threonine-protein kinase NCRK [Vigna radiata var. radiata]XP_022634220.1 receptor-like serine/threonine-protein kinase NCRK [Vigna radiata var. radiata]XP_022634221.1 receptor-like serine/thre
MKPQLKIALALVISLLWIQSSFCGDASDNLNKWRCRCSFEGNRSFSLANCSKSCDCHSDAEESASVWKCICDSNGFPQVAADGHSPNCFKACNCTWGTVRNRGGSKKRVSIKIVVVILLICVICTTMAFLVSLLCHVYRRDRCTVQSPIFSTYKETSSGSTTNLISHRSGASSVPETKFAINSPICHITGCFQKASFLFGSPKETYHGNIFPFSLAELENATENFSSSNLIGLGGSSYVYHGRLKDGSDVAVKRLKDQGGPEADSAFFKEIELLSRLHHCHLVPLLGYCSELKGKHVQRLLVFDYMANGNLRDCLDGISGKHIDWATRVMIALGAAKGLEYLHEAAAPRILHRDVKSTNILLDENWQAKITDLGMAKNLRSDDLPSCSNSPARMQGTFGYFAPEYAIVGRASLESDVFSFGVVLLELISGRQPIHKSTGKEESLVIWATPRLQDSRRVIMELVDPQLKGNFPEEEVQVMAYLAKECLLLDPDTRPTMSEVVQILLSISPGKSRRRRNITGSLFQEPQDEEKQRQATPSKFPTHSSLPIYLDHNHSVKNKTKEADPVSAEYMESLIILASKSDGSCVSEEEMVDLTEPRFESFCITSGKAP